MQLFVIVLSALLAVSLAVPAKPPSRLDNVDVDNVLKSDRLINNYVKCLNGSGRCSPDATELKRILPETLDNQCADCSAKQRANADKVLSHLINVRPELWDELAAIYDPTGKHTKRFQEQYKKKN